MNTNEMNTQPIADLMEKSIEKMQNLKRKTVQLIETHEPDGIWYKVFIDGIRINTFSNKKKAMEFYDNITTTEIVMTVLKSKLV
jgi:G:T/U-mismatch repair DNA glycosylase